jgi:hypothetical protein
MEKLGNLIVGGEEYPVWDCDFQSPFISLKIHSNLLPLQNPSRRLLNEKLCERTRQRKKKGEN